VISHLAYQLADPPHAAMVGWSLRENQSKLIQ
jgi:hypothetical protein